MPLPLLAAGIGVASAGRSWWLGRERANLQRAETDETVRRMRLERDRAVSTATAYGAASGVEFESRSLQDYLAAMTEEFNRQIAWTHRTGRRSAGITDQAANFGLVTDLGSTLIGYGNASNWWRRPPGGTG